MSSAGGLTGRDETYVILDVLKQREWIVESLSASSMAAFVLLERNFVDDEVIDLLLGFLVAICGVKLKIKVKLVLRLL